MDFKNESLDEFYETCCLEAENDIKSMLVIGAIAEAENIHILDEDVGAQAKDYNIRE